MRNGWKGAQANWSGALLVSGLAICAAIVGCKRELTVVKDTTATTVPTGKTTLLRGSGSTFAEPIYSKWFELYQAVAPDVAFGYTRSGSSAGIRDVLKGDVDFAGSEAPVSDEQLQLFEARFGCRLLHLPMALGGGVPAFNVAGLSQGVNFTSKALAGIYLGKITRWNDPEIAAVNAGVSLPDAAITVIHRSDGSGTSYVWSAYLSGVSDEWKRTVGTSTLPAWPIGLAAEGNKGVAAMIQQVPYSLGYVELTIAIEQKLAYGAVQNSAGKFARADSESLRAAAKLAMHASTGDFRVSIVNCDDPNAYPIASFTWMLVPEKIVDASRRSALVAFLRWALTAGQDALAPLNYGRLPAEVIEKEKSSIDGID